MKLGEIIRTYRKDHKMTLKDFAAKSGLTYSYISRLERDCSSHGSGSIIPSLLTYKQCAVAMDLTLDELVKMVDGNERISIATTTKEEQIHYHYQALSQLLGLDVNDIAKAMSFVIEMKSNQH